MQSKQNIYCIKCHKSMYFTGTVNFYFLNIRGVNQCLNKKCENYWLTNKVYFKKGELEKCESCGESLKGFDMCSQCGRINK